MFQVMAQEGAARMGKLRTPHGVLDTPAFLPVATQGFVKGLGPDEVRATGAQAMIVNALHLWLKAREGPLAHGGLHGFTGWSGPLFTDSGGFQIIRKDFALGVGHRGLAIAGASGQVDFTPEECLAFQAQLGSDVAFVLDHCPPFGRSHRHHAEALARTIAWARRSLAVRPDGQLIFGIFQGGTFHDLRAIAVEALGSMAFDGFGIGGLSIGEPREVMFSILESTLAAIPDDRPRHLLGVGSPREILDSVALGIDIFDSAFPTRNGRHGSFYTPNGPLDITAAKFAGDAVPLVEGCRCIPCTRFSRGQLHHAMRTDEPLAGRMLSTHNLHYMQQLMGEARRAIAEENFEGLRREFRARWGPAGAGL